MADEDDDPKAARYPQSDATEHAAVDTLNYILDSSAKSYVDSRDKAPNHDGWVELVDEGSHPVGRVVVQVKKLPEGNVEDPKIQIETRHLSYCYVPIEPFILIAVDTENEVAYWQHITSEWFKEQGLENQDYKTVSFSTENTIEKETDSYIDRWIDIINRTRQRVENYDEYIELKKNSNPAIGKEDPRFEQIHAFLDSYNGLLESEFSAVKEGLYSGVWKFGFGSTSYEEDQLSYTIYPINKDENDAQIREIDSSWDAVHKLGSNRRAGVPKDNPLRRNPERYAYNVLEHEVKTLIDKKKLDYSGCSFIALEYVYPFVDKFHSILGLENKTEYSVSEVRDGYYRYLQFWLSAEMRDILQEHERGEVHVGLDGYVETDITPTEERAHEVARERVENIDGDPPRHQIHGDNFDQEVLETMIDVLDNSSIETIENPYTIRDKREADLDEVSHVLDFYSEEAIFNNIRTYETNYLQEYESLLDQNFPEIKDELLQPKSNLVVVVIYSNETADATNQRPNYSFHKIWLESDEEQLEINFHWSEDDEVPDNANPWDSETYIYEGNEYNIISWETSSEVVITDLDHNQRLVLDDLHKKLDRHLRDYIGKKKVQIRHPQLN